MFKKFTMSLFVGIIALVATLMLLSFTLVAAQDGNDTAEDVAAITAIITERYPAFANSHDAAGYASMYTEDALWVPPNAPERVGREAIEAAMQASFDKFEFDVQPFADEVKVMANFAYITGGAEGVLTPRDGSDSTPVNFRVFWLFQRGDDGWEISRQIWNNKPSIVEAPKAFESSSLLTEVEYMK